MASAVLKDLFEKLRTIRKSPTSASKVMDSGSPLASSSFSASSCPWPEKALRRVFSSYDSNGDGKISVDDLEVMARAIGNITMTANPDNHCSDFKAEASAMMELADLDGDGYIDFHEFAACISTKTPLSSDGKDCRHRCSGDDEDLKLAFAVYDQNGDGVITAEELHHVLRRIFPGTGANAKTLADCRNMIRAVDRDGDDAVSFEEFAAMMRAVVC